MCLIVAAGGMVDFVQAFGLLAEILSSWGTGPVSPLSLHLPAPTFPWRAQDKLFYKPLWPTGASPGQFFFSPNVQAHWRGYRQKKMYLERLQYFKANADAVIKVAVVIGQVPGSLERSPENRFFWSSHRRVISGNGALP